MDCTTPIEPTNTATVGDTTTAPQAVTPAPEAPIRKIGGRPRGTKSKGMSKSERLKILAGIASDPLTPPQNRISAIALITAIQNDKVVRVAAGEARRIMLEYNDGRPKDPPTAPAEPAPVSEPAPAPVSEPVKETPWAALDASQPSTPAQVPPKPSDAPEPLVEPGSTLEFQFTINESDKGAGEAALK